MAIDRSNLNALLATDPLIGNELNRSVLGQVITGQQPSLAPTSAVLPNDATLLQSGLVNHLAGRPEAAHPRGRRRGNESVAGHKLQPHGGGQRQRGVELGQRHLPHRD
jgi:hypothetical protein